MQGMEYKFDEDGTFRMSTLIRFSQCDAREALSLAELLRLSSDAGVEDYRLKGLPREKLEEAGYAILVSRTSFRLHRLPSEGEEVGIVTLEEAPEPLLLVRSYTLLGEGDEVLATGVGKWIVVDTKSRRIIPSARFTMRRPSEVKREHDCLSAGKIAKCEGMIKAGERRIVWSDLDANGHTNNSRYAEFVMDAVGTDYVKDKRITDFRINFNQEAKLGEVLSVYAGCDEGQEAEHGGKRIYVEGTLESSEGKKGAVSFEAELIVKE